MSDKFVPDENTDIRVAVRQRYGSIAENAGASPSCCAGPSSESCCGPEEETYALTTLTRLYADEDIQELPPEVTGLSLGCGDPVTLASLQPGQTVLDLGSGGGIDCFLAARKVGPGGRVIGVDMTAAMIEKARANKSKIGAPNVEFRLGEIEHLPVGDQQVDVILSNCVINLSPDKPQVFREAFRVLKPGGKLAVSDIVTNGPLPEEVKANLSAWAECIAGALDIRDYIQAIEAAGFTDVSFTPANGLQEDIAVTLEPQDPGPGEVLIQVDEIGASKPVEPLTNIFSAKVTAYKPG
jgi:arsenite methyltransferase